jgi:hypothetical protein
MLELPVARPLPIEVEPSASMSLMTSRTVTASSDAELVASAHVSTVTSDRWSYQASAASAA